MPRAASPKAHLHHTVHQRVKALAHKAQRGDGVQHVLQVAARAGVRVDAAQHHVALGVQAAIQGLRCVQPERLLRGIYSGNIPQRRQTLYQHCLRRTCKRLCTAMVTACAAMQASMFTKTKRLLRAHLCQPSQTQACDQCPTKKSIT